MIFAFQALDSTPIYVVEVLVDLTKESAKTVNTACVKPCPGGVLGEMQVKNAFSAQLNMKCG